MKRKHELVEYEQHYYKEQGKKVVPIEDEAEQRKIDKYLEKNHTTPGRTTRESGYSAYMFTGKELEVNESMLKKRKIDKNHYLISRMPEAPKLPVSCLASTEHVVAMQDDVENFESELKPKTKKDVMYLIQLSCNTKRFCAASEKKSIFRLLRGYDNSLTKDKVDITYNKVKGVFEIRVGTQVADIQLLVESLTSMKKYSIVDCDFDDIGLNQGVCLIKRDASNPIHALANIANSDSEKGFLERDAGTTSGLFTTAYQDNNWTFNFFSGLNDMREKTEYPKDSFAIKIYNQNSFSN